MANTTDYASTLEGLCDQLDAFCKQHQLPKLSADELLCKLYSEEPRRGDLCEWVRGFIETWDAACDAEQRAKPKREGDAQ
jgi:hypothetical protein